MIISQDKIQMDPAKLSAVLKWPLPKCVNDIQSFLGFGNFIEDSFKDLQYHDTTHIPNPERHHVALDNDQQTAFGNTQTTFMSAQYSLCQTLETSR